MGDGGSFNPVNLKVSGEYKIWKPNTKFRNWYFQNMMWFWTQMSNDNNHKSNDNTEIIIRPWKAHIILLLYSLFFVETTLATNDHEQKWRIRMYHIS